VRRLQQSDGSLRLAELADDAKGTAQEDTLACAGLAVQAIIVSQKRRPSPWKLEMARKARAFSHACWQQKKSVPLAVSHTPAWSEAYLQTQEQAYADLVFAMNDWLCTLQYDPGDSVRADWAGGFRPWVDGQAVMLPPDIRSAEAAEILAQACRVARAAGDLPRLQRHRRALAGGV